MQHSHDDPSAVLRAPGGWLTTDCSSGSGHLKTSSGLQRHQCVSGSHTHIHLKKKKKQEGVYRVKPKRENVFIWIVICCGDLRTPPPHCASHCWKILCLPISVSPSIKSKNSELHSFMKQLYHLYSHKDRHVNVQKSLVAVHDCTHLQFQHFGG